MRVIVLRARWLRQALISSVGRATWCALGIQIFSLWSMLAHIPRETAHLRHVIIIPKTSAHIPSLSAYLSKHHPPKHLRTLSAQDVLDTLPIDHASLPTDEMPDVLSMMWPEKSFHGASKKLKNHPDIAAWIADNPRDSTETSTASLLLCLLLIPSLETLWTLFNRIKKGLEHLLIRTVPMDLHDQMRRRQRRWLAILASLAASPYLYFFYCLVLRAF